MGPSKEKLSPVSEQLQIEREFGFKGSDDEQTKEEKMAEGRKMGGGWREPS